MRFLDFEWILCEAFGALDECVFLFRKGLSPGGQGVDCDKRMPPSPVPGIYNYCGADGAS